MRATDIKVGMVINWRGQPATVVAAWNTLTDSPVRMYPVGIEVEIVENDEPKRFRIMWPDHDARELREAREAMARPELAAEAQEWLDAVLELHLNTITVELWNG